MSEMISVASGFQYSVNIGYDLHNEDKLKISSLHSLRYVCWRKFWPAPLRLLPNGRGF